MASFTRRDFLRTAVAAGGSILLGGCQQIPTSERTHEAVVIGSGFGGAVAALRLAEAGVETAVLERGRKWTVAPPYDTFPRMLSPDKRSAWLSHSTQFPGLPFRVFSKYTGLVERVKGDGMDVIVGAGVGGSSLVFGGMFLQPSQALFHQVFPQIPYSEMADVWFPKAKQGIGAAKIPDAILASQKYLSTQKYLQQAAAAGLDGQKIDCAVNWNVVAAEMAGAVPASASIGESVLGMNSGAKNSVDRNYLPAAEATGNVTILPLHVVKSIAVGPLGYDVTCDRIDEQGNVVEYVIVHCAYLFLAAGSMGTSKLLVKAKTLGTLPALNPHVGKHWGNNGDRLFMRILWQSTGAPQGGPACAAIFHHNNPVAPVTFEHGPNPLGIDLHLMAMLGMGIPQGEGHFTYDPGADKTTLHWPVDADLAARQAMKVTMDQLNAASGTIATIDMNLVDRYTYHPLGGAVLGKACDLYGRVLGHPKLYVVDASLIPGSTACCNPAWTVTALAERCMAKIVAEDL